MKTYFTADLHFHHVNIIKYCNRPFASVEEMDTMLISNWNSIVNPEDTVWIVGDVFFCNEDKALEIVSQLKGKKKLLLGNHDRMILKSEKLKSKFAEVHDGIVELKIDNKFVVLCHYPMMSWNRSFHGSYHLHGHTHGSIPFDSNYKRLDVGADVHNYTPIEWTSIITKMENK